jgi:Holliday junction DNA helicase RuvA
MISYLIGKPIINGDTIIVLVNGVGYEVTPTNAVLAKATHNQELEIHVYTHVKEDVLALYGFQSVEEKKLFTMVMGVSGVGPSTAIKIVSAGAEKVLEAIQQAQVSFFKSIPRVGKKLAQKIIIELGSKVGEIKKLNLGTVSPLVKDLEDSLIALGFSEVEIEPVLQEIDVETLGIEKAVPAALKKLRKK